MDIRFDVGRRHKGVRLSERAARRVQELIASEGKSSLMLRVYIEGGGCSGFQYGFALEEGPAEDDVVVEHHGVSMLVDPMSLHYLDGAEVDFKDDLQGARFLVNNPNAATTCGCGSSFAV